MWAVLHLMAYYGAAGLAWGLALKGNLLWASISGVIVALVVSALFVLPVLTKQRSEERTQEVMFAIGAIWGNLAILAGGVGIIVWLVRLVFF